jgi:hypothetical protein
MTPRDDSASGDDRSGACRAFIDSSCAGNMQREVSTTQIRARLNLRKQYIGSTDAPRSKGRRIPLEGEKETSIRERGGLYEFSSDSRLTVFRRGRFDGQTQLASPCLQRGLVAPGVLFVARLCFFHSSAASTESDLIGLLSQS